MSNEPSASDRPQRSRALADLVRARLDRREFLGAGIGLASFLGLGVSCSREDPAPRSTLGFAEIRRGADGRCHVPEGYECQVLLSWGDPIFADGPAYDPEEISVAAQLRQFGDSCDFVAFMPLPRGSQASDHGLLVVNHEFTRVHMRQTGIHTVADAQKLEKRHAEAELASQGLSVVEIRLEEGRWTVRRDGSLNRRIDGLTTPIAVSGPAAGHPRLRTAEDPEGRMVRGTFANCSGGTTPWGTVLTCEENFQDYFLGDPQKHHERRSLARYGVLGKPAIDSWRAYFLPRFDLGETPNEPNRFGWVVEVDPYDPQSTPKKRTALGRFRHEAATTAVDPGGQVVVYTGDDAPGEYLYRFVTKDRWDETAKTRNADLLDEGTLSAARLDADGSLTWLPLVHGSGPLTAENGFESQADVLIDARLAADLLGATPMDRPEDFETNPVNGKVYVMLTNNVVRGKVQALDAANPRPLNQHGHILELSPPDGRHAADRFTWDIFLLGGDPAQKADLARSGKGTSPEGWVSCPDNCAFDGSGHLWIATDGAAGGADGVFACDVDGEGRAQTRMFFRAPLGAEVCGPCFTADDRSFFVAVQHPGHGEGFTFDRPACRFPDDREGWPPRSSVVVIRRKDGGKIGT